MPCFLVYKGSLGARHVAISILVRRGTPSYIVLHRERNEWSATHEKRFVLGRTQECFHRYRREMSLYSTCLRGEKRVPNIPQKEVRAGKDPRTFPLW